MIERNPNGLIHKKTVLPFRIRILLPFTCFGEIPRFCFHDIHLSWKCKTLGCLHLERNVDVSLNVQAIYSVSRELFWKTWSIYLLFFSVETTSSLKVIKSSCVFPFVQGISKLWSRDYVDGWCPICNLSQRDSDFSPWGTLERSIWTLSEINVNIYSCSSVCLSNCQLSCILSHGRRVAAEGKLVSELQLGKGE